MTGLHPPDRTTHPESIDPKSATSQRAIRVSSLLKVLAVRAWLSLPAKRISPIIAATSAAYALALVALLDEVIDKLT